MTTSAPETAPVLSTPDTHIFEDPTPPVDTSNILRLSYEQIALTYEIERTVKEIKEGKWKRIALQFPDHMLPDAPRVYEALSKGLRNAGKALNETVGRNNDTTEEELAKEVESASISEQDGTGEKLFILADTSYGACCVDEVAAEHVDADVVVHYGRSCLSPPSRLPVIYVFTTPALDLETVLSAFKTTYPNQSVKAILMADIPYSHHIPRLHTRLQQDGYTHIHATEIIHNPSSLLPNRTVPANTADSNDALRDYQLFHISEPPTSLILTLSSRVSAIHIYPTTSQRPATLLASTTATLRRRYALLTSLSTTPVFGILINTLSVKNYMHILAHVQRLISAAGKKSYTFVVGKVNAAKVANFSEVGGWVVIGCWESSLIESRDFWRPIITPFELGLCLQRDDERVWTGEWTADFQAVLEERREGDEKLISALGGNDWDTGLQDEMNGAGDGEYDSEEESAPPEFDLRTGRYVSHSRPMRPSSTNKVQDQVEGEAHSTAGPSSTALTKRANGDIAHVGGVLSLGAEFLRSKRMWQGLGSDYSAQQEENVGANGHAAIMEEGRTGIARGYTVGDEETQH